MWRDSERDGKGDREKYRRRGGKMFEDATLPLLKVEEGSIGQVIWQPAEVGKSKGTDVSLEPREGIQLCRHLDLQVSCRVVREYICIILHHWVCDNFSWLKGREHKD